MALDGLRKELSQGSAPQIKATVEQGRVQSVERDVRAIPGDAGRGVAIGKRHGVPGGVREAV